MNQEFLGQMLEIPSGTIELRNEKSGLHWQVALEPFLLARFPVTRSTWSTLRTGEFPLEEPEQPQTEVSWFDAVAFCNEASAAAGLHRCYSGESDGSVAFHPDADGYRLPTEAEWEHACRAGSADVRYGNLDEIAWHAGNSLAAIHDVGGKRPNAWGLSDMIGNAWEWCWDLFDPVVYGEYRVFRGGGFADPSRACRASCRRKSHPSLRIDDLGFRVARNLG